MQYIIKTIRGGTNTFHFHFHWSVSLYDDTYLGCDRVITIAENGLSDSDQMYVVSDRNNSLHSPVNINDRSNI